MAIKRIRLVHLYPDELNLYGDGGNVLCIKKRLEKRGIETEIIPVGKGKTIPDFDIMFIGGGQDKEMRIIAQDVRKKAEMLRFAIENGKVIFAVCGGYQLLGEYYMTSDGDRLNLSCALPFYTEAGRRRMIGNTVFETPFCTAVGFENHSGKTYLCGLSPLGKVISGFGNNGEDGGEGLLYKNTFCTYAHGPLLPKNPVLCDEILSRALGFKLEPIDDGIETLCNRQLINRFK